MVLDHIASDSEKSLALSSRSFVTRHWAALYVVLAAVTSLGVVWNWNWLTGVEVFRIMAALPCSFMMLNCMRRAACKSSP